MNEDDEPVKAEPICNYPAVGVSGPGPQPKPLRTDVYTEDGETCWSLSEDGSKITIWLKTHCDGWEEGATVDTTEASRAINILQNARGTFY